MQALKCFASSSSRLSAKQVECWVSEAEEPLSFDLRDFTWTHCTLSFLDWNMAPNILILQLVVLRGPEPDVQTLVFLFLER